MAQAETIGGARRAVGGPVTAVTPLRGASAAAAPPAETPQVAAAWGRGVGPTGGAPAPPPLMQTMLAQWQTWAEADSGLALYRQTAPPPPPPPPSQQLPSQQARSQPPPPRASMLPSEIRRVSLQLTATPSAITAREVAPSSLPTPPPPGMTPPLPPPPPPPPPAAASAPASTEPAAFPSASSRDRKRPRKSSGF